MFGNVAIPRSSCGILTYDAALNKYSSIRPIRGRATDTRPLGDRRNDRIVIRMLDNRDIAIRHHSTDVIVYHTDGTISLEVYASKTTNEVVGHILRGSHIVPHYTASGGAILHVRDKFYRVSDVAVLDINLNLVSGSIPFTRHSVDRKRSNAACAKGFNQFAMWVNTQVRLGLDPRGGSRWGGPARLTTHQIVTLDDPTTYAAIAREMSTFVTIEAHLKNIRSQVQSYYDCIKETDLPYLTSHGEVASVQASNRRLG